jgi:PadR family transcriptional regulator, regulatory protein AphA
MARNTEHVILGMLAFEPMSGYAIRQAIRQSVALFWSESDRQLYPALKRLLNQCEIMIVSSDAELKRSKTVYDITESGKQKLQSWLAMPVMTNSVRNEFCLKIFFGGHAQAGVVMDMIQAEKSMLQRSLAGMKKIDAEIESETDPQHKVYWRATARYGESILHAKLKWCNEVLTSLQGNH